MIEAELKKLNRAELLTMLVSMTRRCDELEAEVEELNKQLKDRKIEAREIGSLAEAALKINRVMEAADQAAAQYLENVKRMAGGGGDPQEMEKNTKERCAKIEEETKKRCEQMIEKAKADSQTYWDEVYARIKQYEDTK